MQKEGVAVGCGKATGGGWFAADAVGSTARADADGLDVDGGEVARRRGDARVSEGVLFAGGGELAKVVEAGALDRGLSGRRDLGYRNDGQQADDGHDDHDLHEGECRRGGPGVISFSMFLQRFHVRISSLR